MLQNLEIEQTLIGLAMNDFSCAEKFVILPKDTFTDANHKLIYQIICGIVKKGKVPDLLTVSNKVGSEDGSLISLLMKCNGMGFSPAMYEQYETTALDLRRRRNIRDSCANVTAKITNPMEDAENLVTELAATINDNAGRPQAQNMREALIEFTTQLEKKNQFLSTGIAAFDRKNGGFRAGQLIYLGARPGVGKTALGLSIAMHIADKAGPVLIISLEMSVTEILERMTAAWTGIELRKIVSHDISDTDWGTIWGQTSELDRLPIRFAMAGTPMKIKREAAAIKREIGLSLIMIDYVQLLHADGSYKSRYEEVSEISRQLKLMAMELEVPILALTQFNRNAEQRGSNKPSMADARDSGSLEQDANVFLVQYAPDEPDSSTGLREYWQGCQDRGTEFQVIVCEKYRQGEPGTFPVEFDKPHMKFRSFA